MPRLGLYPGRQELGFGGLQDREAASRRGRPLCSKSEGTRGLVNGSFKELRY